MKIILGVIASSVLVFASSNIQDELDKALAEKKALDKKIALLKSQLPKKEKKKDFITHTEFGYIKTGGNTDTQTFNLEVEVKKSWDKQSLKTHLDAQYAQDKGTKSKDKYFLELDYNYNLNSKLAVSYIAGYRDDKFSTYKYQFYTGPGLSYQINKQKKQKLEFNSNILFSQDKTDVRKDYLSFRSKGIYSWQILDNLNFKQTLSYRTEVKQNDNYFIYAKSSLSTKLSEIFSAGLSYKYDYVNLPADDKVHKDDTLTVNLIIDY